MFIEILILASPLIAIGVAAVFNSAGDNMARMYEMPPPPSRRLPPPPTGGSVVSKISSYSQVVNLITELFNNPGWERVEKYWEHKEAGIKLLCLRSFDGQRTDVRVYVANENNEIERVETTVAEDKHIAALVKNHQDNLAEQRKLEIARVIAKRILAQKAVLLEEPRLGHSGSDGATAMGHSSVAQLTFDPNAYGRSIETLSRNSKVKAYNYG